MRGLGPRQRTELHGPFPRLTHALTHPLSFPMPSLPLVPVLPEEKLAATFFEVAAAKGHSGAMVALGNICLMAAEAAPEEDETKSLEIQELGETEVVVGATGEDTGAGEVGGGGAGVHHPPPTLHPPTHPKALAPLAPS